MPSANTGAGEEIQPLQHLIGPLGRPSSAAFRPGKRWRLPVRPL